MKQLMIGFCHQIMNNICFNYFETAHKDPDLCLIILRSSLDSWSETILTRRRGSA
jgi:hypothetical protein